MTQDAPKGWSDALALAVARHGETLRKGGGRVPYVTHVVDVAETLAYHYPERDDLIVAGLLHDVVEDTNTTLDEVRSRFGDAVANLGAIARDLRNVGSSVWGRFKVGRDESLWFYRSIVERVVGAIGEEALAGELRSVYESVAAS